MKNASGNFMASSLVAAEHIVVEVVRIITMSRILSLHFPATVSITITRKYDKINQLKIVVNKLNNYYYDIIEDKHIFIFLFSCYSQST